MTQLTHVVTCDGQQAKLIAILEQIALLHKDKNLKNNFRQNDEEMSHDDES
jgi:hypothetical protein